MIRAAGPIVLLAVLLGGRPLLAYGNYTFEGEPVRWAEGWAAANLHPFSFEQGSDAELAAMFGLVEWNLVAGSGWEFFLLDPPLDTDPLDNGDGVSTVSFLLPEAFPEGVYSATLLDTDGAEILEADTAFNSGVPWTLDDPDPLPPYENVDFIGVAGHEFGHALGLLHEDRRIVARMNTAYSAQAAWIAHADDRLGVRFLYPGEGLEVDLYGHTWIKETDGEEPAVPAPSPAPEGLRPGDAFRPQVTVENLGSEGSGPFSVALLLSADAAPSPDDILAGGRSGISARDGAVGTFEVEAAVPAGTAPGEYVLLLLVDSEGVIEEADEEENFAAFADPIRILGGEAFRRGDASGDGAVDIGDAIASLNHLFASEPAPRCPDAEDWDDDGKLTIGDPIGLLNYLFAGGTAGSPPGPAACGPDPTADGLGPCDDPHCP